MPTVDALSDIVQIISEITGDNPPGASFSSCLIVDEFGGWGTDRVREYSGPRSAALASWVADGGAEGDAVYGAISRFFSQRSCPPTVKVGRRDAGDVSWTASLTAIRAADAEWYAFCAPSVRDAATIEEIDAWAAAAGMQLFAAQTADADVYSGASGNLAEILSESRASDSVGRTVLIWHDPETASGAAAPTATIEAPAVGTYSLTPGASCNLLVDEGAPQTFTLSAAAAVVTGSNNQPFNLANGNVLVFAYDDGANLTVTLSASAASVASGTETFDLSGAIGGTVEVVTDSGTDSYTLSSGVAPDLPTPATTSAAAIVANFNNYISGSVAVASAAGGVVTFKSATVGSSARFRFTATTDASFLTNMGVGTDEVAGTGNVGNVDAVTAQELVALCNAASGSAGTASIAPTTKLRLTGSTAGTDGKVTISASSTAGLLTALGLSAGVTAGTGDVGNAAAITPAALQGLLSTAWASDCTVTLDSPDIVIEGTTGVGYYHTLRFVGALRSDLGLPSGLIRGEGVEDDYADAAILGARMGISIDERGLQTWNLCPLAGCYGDEIPAGTRTRLHEDDGVCTVEARRPSTSTPQLMTGRLVAGLANGEPVYVDARIGIDWLGVRIQEALSEALFEAAAAGESIPYTDRDARGTILTSISEPLRLAALRNVITAADLTPPTGSKLTGLTIARLADLSSSNRAARRWTVTSSQAAAGFLHGAIVTNQVSNA